MLNLLRKAKHTTEEYIDRVQYRNYYQPKDCIDIQEHIKAAIQWLCRAQDYSDDLGVSYGCKFGSDFQESYPETTGYIIPTFIKLGKFYSDNSYLRRALEMGHWEASVQMACGAVMGGKFNKSPTPALFNTGQVLLGWAALVNQLQDERCIEAGHRAAQWMQQMQEENGNWEKCNSNFCNNQSTIYNVRAAWGLAQFGKSIAEQSYIETGLKFAEFAKSKQLPNGWFDECCLTDREKPLLHTIAYTMRGFFELGIQEKKEEYISIAKHCADQLIDCMNDDGFLPGRFDQNWRPSATYCCLTGSAQTSIVWSKLYLLTHDNKYLRALKLVNLYLMRHHDIHSPHNTIRGGLAGSWPIYGAYGKFMVLNWATKFLVDALLYENEITNQFNPK